MHGTIMIFLWIIPFNAGLSNFLVPLMIGARDMSFPLLNAISFWILPPAVFYYYLAFSSQTELHKLVGGLIHQLVCKL